VRWATSSARAPTVGTDQTPMNKDLCTALRTSCPDCTGYLEADDFRFLIYPGMRNDTCISSTGTLGQLLSNPSFLSRRRRYSIALTLASSYLQLSATPWLSMSLRKESVVFLQPTADPQSALFDRPYLQQEPAQVTSQPSTDTILKSWRPSAGALLWQPDRSHCVPQTTAHWRRPPSTDL
jgi:hypothetical protein